MQDRSMLAERSFERLAEIKGDITQAVLETYYRAHPDARASFEHHGLGNTAELEGRMVAETVFLLMQWAANPRNAQIEQGTTICHHHDTMEIGPRWYLGLIDAVLSELLDSIPATERDEVRVWESIRSEIAEFITSVRGEFIKPDKDGELPPFIHAQADH
ncbi:MAG: hypothetical protein EP341_01905 [Sphingomonadales bacterium]|nr:MAG: hypothetical protein EP341_01905 [Sphingomonadales bacterium]